ncbi:MAG: hypothetical protein IKJ34_02385, partial [Mailhella sp.]|nr:hypothetical protein [Mailhella sp.]
MFAFSSPSSLGRMLPSRPLAKRFLLASTLSLLILPLGCNATGASVADWQTASSETFLSKEQMERGRYSLQAELTFAQLKLSKALMSDDHDAVLEAANSLLETSPRGGVFSASAVVDAAIWLLAHEHEEEAMELVERSSAIMPEELPL